MRLHHEGLMIGVQCHMMICRGHIKASKGALQIILQLMVLCKNGHFSQILHFCLYFLISFHLISFKTSCIFPIWVFSTQVGRAGGWGYLGSPILVYMSSRVFTDKESSNIIELS